MAPLQSRLLLLWLQLAVECGDGVLVDFIVAGGGGRLGGDGWALVFQYVGEEKGTPTVTGGGAVPLVGGGAPLASGAAGSSGWGGKILEGIVREYVREVPRECLGRAAAAVPRAVLTCASGRVRHTAALVACIAKQAKTHTNLNVCLSAISLLWQLTDHVSTRQLEEKASGGGGGGGDASDSRWTGWGGVWMGVLTELRELGVVGGVEVGNNWHMLSRLPFLTPLLRVSPCTVRVEWLGAQQRVDNTLQVGWRWSKARHSVFLR